MFLAFFNILPDAVTRSGDYRDNLSKSKLTVGGARHNANKTMAIMQFVVKMWAQTGYCALIVNNGCRRCNGIKSSLPKSRNRFYAVCVFISN